MTLWNDQTIGCNDCERATLDSTSLREARREAKALGWYYVKMTFFDGSRGYIDICPACWAKREEGANELYSGATR